MRCAGGFGPPAPRYRVCDALKPRERRKPSITGAKCDMRSSLGAMRHGNRAQAAATAAHHHLYCEHAWLRCTGTVATLTTVLSRTPGRRKFPNFTFVEHGAFRKLRSALQAGQSHSHSAPAAHALRRRPFRRCRLGSGCATVVYVCLKLSPRSVRQSRTLQPAEAVPEGTRLPIPHAPPSLPTNEGTDLPAFRPPSQTEPCSGQPRRGWLT